MCHPGDIFCHHQNPSLGGSGSARPPRNALARSRHLPLWPPPSAGPHKWAWAFDQHIFADARSASLRKLGLWLVSELSPLGKMGLAWRPSEGRALHDRQGTPCPTVAFPPLATAFGPTAQMGLGIRPTNVRGRAERIPPQTIFGPTNIPCAFPARPHARGWPLGGSGSARPPRNASARPCHVPCWPPALAQPHRMFGLRTTAIQGPTAFIEAFPSATYPCSIHCG